MPIQDRIIELEIKLTETMRLGDELSDIVADQAKRIDVLEKRVQALIERVASAEASGENSGVMIADQPPPHW